MTSARRSPPTQRVISLLDHFVAHPGGRFGLSELARELEMSKPTCLGIVTTLVESGHLVYDPHTKTYALGPALIPVGRLAQQNFAAADVADRSLAQLSNRYDAACTASAVVGDQIVVLASTAASHRRPAVPVGQRYPFAPPVGLMYVLWDSDAAFDAWLAKPPTLPVRLDHAHLRTVVAECRTRGYLVEGLTETGRRLHSLMAGVAAYDLPEEVRELVGEMVSNLGERVYLGADLSARGKHPVSMLAAPTYDADGNQELVLTLYVGAAITGAEIARRGAALVAVADAVTAEVGGSRPERKGTT
jgi:DNA-binding IclR family transcriptional regulator